MERKVCSDVGDVGNQHANLKNKVLLGGDDGRENLCEADDMRLSENKLNASRRGKREKAATGKRKERVRERKLQMQRLCVCLCLCRNNRNLFMPEVKLENLEIYTNANYISRYASRKSSFTGCASSGRG